eukprot:6212039-Pleurochrysis_carterae.AAC.2
MSRAASEQHRCGCAPLSRNSIVPTEIAAMRAARAARTTSCTSSFDPPQRERRRSGDRARVRE